MMMWVGLFGIIWESTKQKKLIQKFTIGTSDDVDDDSCNHLSLNLLALLAILSRIQFYHSKKKNTQNREGTD